MIALSMLNNEALFCLLFKQSHPKPQHVVVSVSAGNDRPAIPRTCAGRDWWRLQESNLIAAICKADLRQRPQFPRQGIARGRTLSRLVSCHCASPGGQVALALARVACLLSTPPVRRNLSPGGGGGQGNNDLAPETHLQCLHELILCRSLDIEE